MSSYTNISNFGNTNPNLSTNDPLTYCLVSELESGFLHGGIGSNMLNKNSKSCQMYTGNYCATNWDDKCEFLYKDTEVNLQNMSNPNCNQLMKEIILTKGDVLLRNTADRKYLIGMSNNCSLVYEPFDPTVASSPLISWWKPLCPTSPCISKYSVNAQGLDNDPVMNIMISKPIIVIDILINIYNTMKSENTYNNIIGTKLYNFFESQQFKSMINHTMKIQQSQNSSSNLNKCYV